MPVEGRGDGSSVTGSLVLTEEQHMCYKLTPFCISAVRGGGEGAARGGEGSGCAEMGKITFTKGTLCTRGAEGQQQSCKLACLSRLATGMLLHSPPPQDQVPLAVLVEDNAGSRGLRVLDSTIVAKRSRTLIGGGAAAQQGLPYCVSAACTPPPTLLPLLTTHQQRDLLQK